MVNQKLGPIYIEVKIIFKNIDSEGHKTNKQKYYSAEFNNLFKECINYIPSQEKDVITTYPVKYVIISDPAFESTLQPLVDWKTKKGFMVVEGYTNDPLVGNTTASIHAYLQNMYDNATIIIICTLINNFSQYSILYKS